MLFFAFNARHNSQTRSNNYDNYLCCIYLKVQNTKGTSIILQLYLLKFFKISLIKSKTWHQLILKVTHLLKYHVLLGIKAQLTFQALTRRELSRFHFQVAKSEL